MRWTVFNSVGKWEGGTKHRELDGSAGPPKDGTTSWGERDRIQQSMCV